MSRDRDPFDRAIDQLRILLRAGAGLQGRPLAINLLAKTIGVSQTPVREALAWLAGEGLIVRTHVGYVGRAFEASSLAELYRLNLAYVGAALSQAPPAWPGDHAWAALEGEDPIAVFEDAVGRIGDRTLLAALRRVREALAPFWSAEDVVVDDAVSTMIDLRRAFPRKSALGGVARAYFRRRARASAAILQATVARLEI